MRISLSTPSPGEITLHCFYLNSSSRSTPPVLFAPSRHRAFPERNTPIPPLLLRCPATLSQEVTMSTVPTLVTVAWPLPATAGTLHPSRTSPRSTAFERMPALRIQTQSDPLYSCFFVSKVPMKILLLASPHLPIPPVFHGRNHHRLRLGGPRQPTSVRIAPLVSVSGAKTAPNVLRSSTHHVNTLLSSCCTATCSAYLPTLLNRSYFGSSALSCSNHRHASHDILTLFVSL